MANPSHHTPPSSTSSQSAGASPDDHPFRVVRKRNRVPLSCGPCRHRKLRCNRAHPCDNCTKRGDVASCTYATPGSRKKGASSGANASPDDMQNRIDRLEGLVLSLMTTGSQPATSAAAQAAIHSSRSESLSVASDIRRDSSTIDMIQEEGPDGQVEDDSEVEQVSQGLGIMKVDNGRTIFASDAHWYAILGELSEVKNYFKEHKEDYKQHLHKVQKATARESSGTAFLLQTSPAKDKAELLSVFPLKADADRLVARYFNAYDPSIHIIHGPSFQKQYDRHWHQPEETTVIWIALCFAMMTLALQSYHRAGDEPPEYRGKALELSHEFRRHTARALLLADITQPVAQVLETLILHMQAEYGRSRDAEAGVLLLISLCVRLAMRMGYHRDPGPFPTITPFQGEIRRRVWTFVRQCDLLISFQFGLPAMVRSEHTDVEPPRNLFDDELSEDMKVLPPSRAAFEATTMSYMIAKSKMTFIFGRILERTQSITNPPSYEEIMAFDQELRDARAAHPTLLQIRPFQESARDPANLIMQRVGLEMVYLRSLFVLHRRFIARGRENPRYAYSRRACIDASMQLLDHQACLHAESQQGGRLRSVKWYISSMTTHDFLLAAMLVCLDLYHSAELGPRQGRSKSTTPASPEQRDGYAEERRQQMMHAVERCIGIWETLREQSMEAYKASITLRVMVDKLKAHEAQRGSQYDTASTQSFGTPSDIAMGPSYPLKRSTGFGTFPNGIVADVHPDDLAPEQSAAMTLGMLSSGGVSPGPGFGGSSGVTPDPKPSNGFPASMAGLLNEVMPERTGLTPQYSGPNDLSAMGAPSPFSQIFGQSSMSATGFGGMEGLSGDIDWGAWDSYIQGTANTAMDPANAIWPMNMDINLLDPQMNSGPGAGAGTGAFPDGSGGGGPV